MVKSIPQDRPSSVVCSWPCVILARAYIVQKNTIKEAVSSTQSTSDLPHDTCVTMHLATKLEHKRSMTRLLVVGGTVL